MPDLLPATAVSPLRQRLIDDMTLRRFSHETQRNYLRDVGRLATFLRRRHDTATADDLRRFQVEQQDAGVPVPTMSGIVSALCFFSRIPSTARIWPEDTSGSPIPARCPWCSPVLDTGPLRGGVA